MESVQPRRITGHSTAMRCCALLWTMLIAAGTRTPARAEDNANQNLYIDYLAGSWDDWSFNADRKWNATEHVHSFSNSGRISFTQAFGAARLHFRGYDTRAFNTTGFTDLEFFIHWGGATPQAMLIYALRNSENDNSAFNKTVKLPLAKYSVPDLDADEDGWNRVRVPLADLGVTNVTDLTDILLSGPTPKVPFWIDDVRLVKGPGPRRVVLNVDAATSIRALDSRHLGINTATWDFQAATPSTISMVKAAGARFFRFPGGSVADTYHWETNTWANGKGGTDTLAFLKLVQAAGGQAVITVNYGTGMPEEAAGWVRFCNVTNNFNVKYWEVGNENYDKSEAGSHDPAVYAQRFAQYVAAMKAVDRSIKVGMPGTYSRKTDPDIPGYSGWGPKVLQALKVTPDFYVIHFYPQVRWSGTPHEDDADLLQYPKDWPTIAQIVRSMLSQYLGAAAGGVEILATESNSTSNPGKQSVNLVNALYLADSVGQVLNAGISSYMWWDLHNSYDTKNNNSPVLYGHRLFGDFGLLTASANLGIAANTPYPTYYALQLVSQLGAEGSHLVAATSNDELLPIYASVRENGDLALLVLNKHSQKAVYATVNVSGFKPAAVQVKQYGVFEDAVGVGVSSYDLPISTPSVTFVFPSYSITVLTLKATA